MKYFIMSNRGDGQPWPIMDDPDEFTVKLFDTEEEANEYAVSCYAALVLGYEVYPWSKP